MNRFVAWSRRDAKIRNGVFLVSILGHALTVVVLVILAVSK